MHCPFSPSSSNPIQFNDFLIRSPLRKEIAEKIPTLQFSDPDIFITFESSHPEHVTREDDLDSLQSDDSLEKIIKKLKLDQDYEKILPNEYNKPQKPQDFSRRSCPFQESTNEEQYLSFRSCIFKQALSQLNFHQDKDALQRNQGKSNDIIVVEEEENPEDENIPDDDTYHTRDSSTQEECQDVLKVHKGAKAIYEARMVNDHEKLLWESFAKVHSHIPNFPLNETKHFDYVTQVLKHQAQHLFQIANKHQQDYLRSKKNKNEKVSSDVIENQTEAKPIQDPRLVFEDANDQELLSKCPVMSNLFQDPEKEKIQTIPTQVQPIEKNFGSNFTFQMPSFPPFGNYQNLNQHMYDPFGSLQCHRYQFNQMFPPIMNAGCPFSNLGSGKLKNQNQPTRERRSAFRKAVEKMKGKK